MVHNESLPKAEPRDVFSYLLAIVGLYIVVISLGALFFQYVNLAFPDVLTGETVQSARQGIRWPLAILTVVFPLYVWLSAMLQKDIALHPKKREFKIRKWLLYFTLFSATLVIVGDLISVLFQFLSGELTVRFFLKVLAVLVIALGVFLYYGWNLRKSIPASAHPLMRVFLQTTLVAVSIAIVAGFFAVGSPFSERLRRFDERRVSDLQSIQFQVVDYWQTKGKLPERLEDLRDDFRGFIPLNDPETSEPYEYRTTGELSFELCASFKTSNKTVDGKSVEGSPLQLSRPIPAEPFGFESNFLHDAQRTCFSRTIDPDRFPLVKPRPL